jgi:hypothetical protein
MKKVVLLVCVIIYCFPAFSQQYKNRLDELNNVIEKKDVFDSSRTKRIRMLQRKLAAIKSGNRVAEYGICLNLYNEYKTFNYEQSFKYVLKLQELGHQMGDSAKVSYGKVKLGFIMLSSGMFKETFELLQTVNVKLLPDTAKTEYYFLNARTFYDLADYDNDQYYSRIYNARASRYIDSGLTLCKPDSYLYLYFDGLRMLKAGNINQAADNLNKLLTSYKLTDHEVAVTASTLSDIYIQTLQYDKAINLLITAAIADIRTSTKETAAAINLAQLLHKKGDVKNAYVYTRQAMDDASFYGARQRKMQVSTILPIIANEKINYLEFEKQALLFYGSLLTLLAIVIVIFAVIIYKQLKKLRIADKIIMEANHRQQIIIDKLNEAETIKEEYIGYYFNLIAVYINKLEKFKISIENKILTKKFDEIRALINSINLRKEREELFIIFDKVFLKIFPNFVDEFNSHFNKEDQIKLLPNQLLNTELRIFALVRLGIIDPEKIAGILEYSLNTIYNYKARIKNKSTLANDEFEKVIMKIKAV